MSKTRTVKGATKVFLPFPSANSAKHISSSKTWKNVAAVDIFCADSPTKRAHLQALTTPNDVLYIRGHCSKGSSSLGSADHDTMVDASEIVDLLIGDPRNPDLAFAFPGIVKVYACESALESTTLWIFNSDAFAQRLADAMWNAGYRSCSYHGYGDTVSTYAYDRDKSTTGATRYKHISEMDSEKLGNMRASAARMQILPRAATG
jgi:hypothetical protein